MNETDHDLPLDPDEPIAPEDRCAGNHLEPKRATFDSPAPLCDGCWWEWWTEGWPS
jgi:hypothetical protein